jgi:hypothetical protein
MKTDSFYVDPTCTTPIISIKDYLILRSTVLLFAWMMVGSLNLSGQPMISGMVPLFAVKGYFITQSGDTLYGKVRYTKLTENYMSQILFTAENGEKTHYDAGSIKELGIEQPFMIDPLEPGEVIFDIYECRPSPKKGVMVFMNRFEKGRITVFQNRNSAIFSTTLAVQHSTIDGIGFSFSSDHGLSIGPTYKVTSRVMKSKCWMSSYFFEKDGGPVTKIEKKNYEALWNDLFGDCPKFMDEIKINSDLMDFKNFILSVEVYNQLCK